MNRVAIVGRSGGGKSTLARQLGERIGAPVVHLDVLFWLPGWTQSEPEPFRARVAAALAGERWITDGGFTAVADLYLPWVEAIVWVDQPRLVCLWRAVARALRRLGESRPDMAAGCVERIDPAFWAYIWNWDRGSRPRLEAAIAAHAPKTPVILLRSDAEIAAFLNGA